MIITVNNIEAVLDNLNSFKDQEWHLRGLYSCLCLKKAGDERG